MRPSSSSAPRPPPLQPAALAAHHRPVQSRTSRTLASHGLRRSSIATPSFYSEDKSAPTCTCTCTTITSPSTFPGLFADTSTAPPSHAAVAAPMDRRHEMRDIAASPNPADNLSKPIPSASPLLSPCSPPTLTLHPRPDPAPTPPPRHAGPPTPGRPPRPAPGLRESPQACLPPIPTPQACPDRKSTPHEQRVAGASAPGLASLTAPGLRRSPQACPPPIPAPQACFDHKPTTPAEHVASPPTPGRRLPTAPGLRITPQACSPSIPSPHG